MVNESSIKGIISDALSQVRTIMDADTIVGKQIMTPSGTVIIPISKVSMGFASGGLDFPKKGDGNAPKSFGGGGGTGVSVDPIGFLVVATDGTVSMLPMTSEKPTTLEKIADLINGAPDLIGRIKNVINGVRPEKADDEKEAEAEEVYNAALAQEIAAAEELEADAVYVDGKKVKHGKISEKTLETGEIK